MKKNNIFKIFWSIFGTSSEKGKGQGQKRLQMWAQFWKKIIWNPIRYKILGKFLKFYGNWIINKNSY